MTMDKNTPNKPLWSDTAVSAEKKQHQSSSIGENDEIHATNNKHFTILRGSVAGDPLPLHRPASASLENIDSCSTEREVEDLNVFVKDLLEQMVSEAAVFSPAFDAN